MAELAVVKRRNRALALMGLGYSRAEAARLCKLRVGEVQAALSGDTRRYDLARKLIREGVPLRRVYEEARVGRDTVHHLAKDYPRSRRQFRGSSKAAAKQATAEQCQAWLEAAPTAADYELACQVVREEGLDPNTIPHTRQFIKPRKQRQERHCLPAARCERCRANCTRLIKPAHLTRWLCVRCDMRETDSLVKT